MKPDGFIGKNLNQGDTGSRGWILVQQEQKTLGTTGARLLLPGAGGAGLGVPAAVDVFMTPIQPLGWADSLPTYRVTALSVQRCDIFITNSWGNAARMADFFNHAITQLFPLLYIGFNMSYIRQ